MNHAIRFRSPEGWPHQGRLRHAWLHVGIQLCEWFGRPYDRLALRFPILQGACVVFHGVSAPMCWVKD